MSFIAGARALFVFLLVVVTWLTLTPNPDDTESGMAITRWIAERLFGEGAYADKVAHFVAYGALGASAALARLRIAGRAAPAIILLAAYGAVLEGVQGLGGVRDPELADAMANAAGALAGYPAAAFLIGVGAARARA